MAIYNTISLIVFAMLVMCAGLSAAVLVRSTPSDSERVHDFVVAETRDSASWTAFGRRWTVDLELSQVMEDNTDYFLGTLVGDASAVASFSLLPGTGLSGMIVTESNTWWIRRVPVPENGYAVDDDALLGVFMHREESVSLDGLSNNFNLPQFGEPLVADDHSDHLDDASSSSQVEDGETRKRAITTYKAGVFYDQKWASSTNNPWSSQANTLSLLNDVNAIYKAAGLGVFTFTYLKQVTNDKTTLNDMLNYFSDTASKSISAMTDRAYTNYLWLVGSNVGGLAFVGTSCKGNNIAQNRKTAVAGLVSFSRLWTVKTIAHELAHNRGANHQFTNACTSTLKTGCQCSVMSYCFPSATNNPDGAVNKFSTTSINEMKAAGCY